MKTFTEFKPDITENIINFLPSTYAEAELRIDTVNKSNGYTYEALVVSRADDDGIIPMLNLTEAYEQYQNGEQLERILTRLADVRVNAPKPSIDREAILYFDKVADRILPRVVNADYMADYLEQKPHIKVEDIAIIFNVIIEESVSGIASAVVTEDLLDVWGVTIEEVQERAIENLASVKPVFTNIFDILTGRNEERSIEALTPEDDMFPMYVLTNKNKTFGASLIFNESLMERITDKLGDVIIIPSSVNEVIIIPKAEAIERGLEDLSEMVQSINESDVEPEERLSNSIYGYDRKSKEIYII